MRTHVYQKSGSYGRDRGGLPIRIDNPNRAQRRLQARQQKNAPLAAGQIIKESSNDFSQSTGKITTEGF